MRPRLVPNWRRVLTRAWSIRLIIIAGVLSGMEIFLSLVDGYLFTDVPRGLFAAGSALVSCLAAVARIVAQTNISGGHDG